MKNFGTMVTSQLENIKYRIVFLKIYHTNSKGWRFKGKIETQYQNKQDSRRNQ